MNDFVGRERELQLLTSAIDQTRSGCGRILLIGGEPGIGKTRLAEEAAGYAASTGAKVLWGRCHETKGAPALWPWIQALRCHVEECDADELAQQLGRDASVVAELVEEIQDRLPKLAQPPDLANVEVARFRLFDALTQFVTRMSQSCPVVVALDDLHWADEATLALLEFMGNEIGASHVTLLGTLRTTEAARRDPLEGVLGSLARLRSFEYITLGALNESDLARLYALQMGREPTSDLLRRIFQRTEGNALFAIEVIRQFAGAEDYSREATAEGRVGSGPPGGARAAVSHRLNTLSSRCLEAIEAAAILGGDFELDPLAMVVGRTREELINALDEALHGALIVESGAAGHFRFAHSLIRESVIAGLSLRDRAQYHADALLALEQYYGVVADRHADELVIHCAEAKPLVGNKGLVHYSLIAGQDAERRYAWDAALRHYQRGLNALADFPIDDQKAQLLVGCARASTSGPLRSDYNRSGQANDMLTNAFDYYVNTDQVERAIETAMVEIDRRRPPGTGDELISRALDLVQKDSYDEARLLWRHATAELGRSLSADEAIDRCRRVIDVAEKHGDKLLRSRALRAICTAYWYSHSTDETLRTGDAAIAAAEEAGDLVSEMVGHWTLANLALQVGKADIALRHANALLPTASRIPGWESISYIVNFDTNVAIGRFGAARNYAERLLGLDLDEPWWQVICLGALATIELSLGNHNKVAELLDRMVLGLSEFIREPKHTVTPIWMVLELSFASGQMKHVDFCEVAIANLSGRTAPIREWNELDVAEGLLAVIRRNENAAKQIYGNIPRDYHYVLRGIDPWRLSGLVARTAGMVGKAAEDFQECIDFNRSAGFLPELAWTCCDYSDLLMDRGTRRDLDHAMRLLEEGAEITQKLGMLTLQKRIEENRSRLTKIVDPAEESVTTRESPVRKGQRRPAHPDGLTPREIEILQLVAKGYTNNDVGRMLHISAKTVAVHLSHIYEKTGCANRTEASAYAIRHGIDELLRDRSL